MIPRQYHQHVTFDRVEIIELKSAGREIRRTRSSPAVSQHEREGDCLVLSQGPIGRNASSSNDGDSDDDEALLVVVRRVENIDFYETCREIYAIRTKLEETSRLEEDESGTTTTTRCFPLSGGDHTTTPVRRTLRGRRSLRHRKSLSPNRTTTTKKVNNLLQSACDRPPARQTRSSSPVIRKITQSIDITHHRLRRSPSDNLVRRTRTLDTPSTTTTTQGAVGRRSEMVPRGYNYKRVSRELLNLGMPLLIAS